MDFLIATSFEGETELANEMPNAPVEEEFPAPRVATATELFAWIRRVLSTKTHLSENAAGLVSIWVISIWLWDILPVVHVW